MKSSIRLSLLGATLLTACISHLAAADAAQPLVAGKTIALKGVDGKLDHLEVDVKG